MMAPSPRLSSRVSTIAILRKMTFTLHRFTVTSPHTTLDDLDNDWTIIQETTTRLDDEKVPLPLTPDITGKGTDEAASSFPLIWVVKI